VVTTIPSTPSTLPTAGRSPWPGLAVCLAAALLGLAVNRLVPVLSALLVAILAGVIVGNIAPGPVSRLNPGTGIAAKRLLRAGIVVLGLKVSIGTIAGLGWQTVVLVVVIVAVGIVGSYWMGRAMGLDADASLLVACGFSICGAAAVAAADGVIRPRKEHVATAIGLVVLFGTAMIAIVPAGVTAMRLPASVAAVWAGGGTHEVAQVVAIGGILGGGALLSAAVVVKLARVVMLAPVMVGMSIWQRRRVGQAGKRPPLVQGFVAGFLVAVLIRSFLPLPAEVLSAADVAQTILLGMAMFALGLGVNRQALAHASGRAVALGVASTVLVNAIALGGALLIG
jgi:uncharacterized integral membrane protein (TIGR00698 family)